MSTNGNFANISGQKVLRSVAEVRKLIEQYEMDTRSKFIVYYSDKIYRSEGMHIYTILYNVN